MSKSNVTRLIMSGKTTLTSYNSSVTNMLQDLQVLADIGTALPTSQSMMLKTFKQLGSYSSHSPIPGHMIPVCCNLTVTAQLTAICFSLAVSVLGLECLVNRSTTVSYQKHIQESYEPSPINF